MGYSDFAFSCSHAAGIPDGNIVADTYKSANPNPRGSGSALYPHETNNSTNSITNRWVKTTSHTNIPDSTVIDIGIDCVIVGAASNPEQGELCVTEQTSWTTKRYCFQVTRTVSRVLAYNGSNSILHIGTDGPGLGTLTWYDLRFKVQKYGAFDRLLGYLGTPGSNDWSLVSEVVVHPDSSAYQSWPKGYVGFGGRFVAFSSFNRYRPILDNFRTYF